MLGIPLGYSWLQLQRQTLSNQANMILDRVRVDTETRLQEGGEIDEALLQRRVDKQSDLNIAISVTYAGVTYSAGDPPSEDRVQKNTYSAVGQSVSVYSPGSAVRAHTASARVLISVAGLAPVALGVAKALWQARGNSMPQDRLSRRAEEMG